MSLLGYHEISEMNSKAYTLGSPRYGIGDSCDKQGRPDQKGWLSQRGTFHYLENSWDIKTSSFHREDSPKGGPVTLEMETV